MSRGTVTVRRSLLAAAAGGCLLAGAAGTWLLVARRPPAATPASQGVAPADRSRPAPAMPGASPGNVSITLTPQVVERAGIVVAAVAGATESSTIEVPGIVEPNAYRKVVVTPVVAGKVTAIGAELGQSVRQGQMLASVYSPELAEARARVRANRAALDAHDRELQRTEKLVAIGAASREELERVHAEHAAQRAELDAVRARLQLLTGSAASDNDSEVGASSVTVRAPLDGTVIERTANVGGNVDGATPLFAVADLSVVWVVADVYERDLPAVSVGSTATVTIPSAPGLRLRGRVSYIDPQIAVATRTAKLRIELPNPGQQLRLGMYVDVVVAADSRGGAVATPPLMVPRTAIQSVGDRNVVYVADALNRQRFIERVVVVGQESGDGLRILSGLSSGELIVADGSFFIRAEIERRGLRSRDTRRSEDAREVVAVPRTASASSGTSLDPPIHVRVTKAGFEPATITTRPGTPTRMVFTRTSDETCATEIAFPSLGIRKALPLNKPIEVQITPGKGSLTFVCGMNMLRGTVIAR